MGPHEALPPSQAESSLLCEVACALGSTLDLTQAQELVVRLAARALGARVGILRLADGRTGRLNVVARSAAEGEPAFSEADTLLAEIVCREAAPALIPNLQQDPRLATARDGEATSALCVPLLRQGGVMGTLGLYGKSADPAGGPVGFGEADLALLVALGNQAAIAIENARLFDESERLALANQLRLRAISILNEIGMAMQGTMQLDALLHVILSGVTFGEGLGFNRAILLLVDESRQVLEGRLGVGPSSGEEAARIWQALRSSTRSLREVIALRVTQASQDEDSAFNRLARSLVVPLRPEAGVLALTALEGRPFRVAQARRDPRVHPNWEGRLDVEEFACVPLVAKGKVVGVIAVDNKFNGRPISDEDLEILSVFANQAGLAVESAQVYTRLEEATREIQRSHHQLLQQERLAALGEMAAHVVHEIRNPLVSIGGFARRLSRRLLGREPEGQYAQIIAREVDRLERIVQDVQGLSRDVHPALVEVDLHELIQDCLVLFAEKVGQQRVQLRLDLAGKPPILSLDPVQVKQAIVNLLANALEAMPESGVLAVATRIVSGEGGLGMESPTGPLPAAERREQADDVALRPLDGNLHRLSPGEWVEVSVGDTGGGVPAEILEEIFNPFFTTKEAGTGLGLTLVRRIARAHRGRVEVDNQPGQGVTFRLWLPGGAVPQGGALAA